jgi:hypothetical protein
MPEWFARCTPRRPRLLTQLNEEAVACGMIAYFGG